MTQIGLLSSVIFIVSSICFSFIFRKQVWVAILSSSVLTLSLFMPLSFGFFLIGTIITYFLGNKRQLSSIWIGASCGILLGVLITYKWTESWIVSEIYFENEGKPLQIIGLSIFVFNAISYLLDIKKGFIKPADSFLKLTNYLLYFPILHAGPLHRFKYLNTQFEQAKITEKSFTNGMRLILWGLFKNLVLAQRLNQLVVSMRDSEIGGWWTLFLGFAFFFYLYFSFSSYVDFFQGVSEIFNIRLKDNFHKRVYFSSSRHEFWKGWHITLNEWFRDYFFYRLIMFKFWRNKPYVLLLLTFMLIGLWHGVTWSFVVWGFLSGFWIIAEKVWNVPEKILRNPFSQFVGLMYHLIFCSFLALIFIFPNINELWIRWTNGNYFPMEVLVLHQKNIGILLFMFIVLDILHLSSNGLRMDLYLESLPPWKRRIFYLSICSFVFLFGVFSGGIDNYYIRF